VTGLPAEFTAERRSVCDEFRWIARAPIRFLHRDRSTDCSRDGRHHFAVGVPLARTEIADANGSAFEQRFDCADVGVREVADVDVVADAGSVRRGVIGAEELEPLAQPAGGFQRRGDQVDLRFVMPPSGSAPLALK